MRWKFTDDQPVYQQIISLLRGAVLSGEYQPGSRIPSVRELATLARVNPNTMQRALLELEREQLLVCGGTTGRYVTDDPTVLEIMREKQLRELAQNCADKFAAFGVTPAQAAELLKNLDENEEK